MNFCVFEDLYTLRAYLSLDFLRFEHFLKDGFI